MTSQIRAVWLRYGLLIYSTIFFHLPQPGAQISSENLEQSAQWLSPDILQLEEIDGALIQTKDKLKKWELNRIKPDELLSLGVLSQWQVDQFFLYKKVMGSFKDLYELQAIPGWSPTVVRAMLPHFMLEAPSYKTILFDSRVIAQSSLLLRVKNLQNRNSSATDWVGSGEGLQLLYRYKLPGLQVGVSMEKDPGERLFSHGVGSRVDFLSAYVVIQPKGLFRSFFIGDYSVNFGQGLIQWQSFALRKTPVVGLLKKQGPSFRPYRSVGEYNFHRGIAISAGKGNHTLDFFLSSRLLSANVGISALNGMVGVTSINTSGYHRTWSEIQKRNNLHQWAAGIRYAVHHKTWNVGFSTVGYLFSKPLVVIPKLYDRYSINDSRWFNSSLDFSFNLGQCHFFGEQAIDKKGSNASVFGGLFSLSRFLEMGMVGRLLSPKFQSLYSSSFTEATMPSNENGFFFLVNARLSSTTQLNFFTDIFNFPWLRFMINRPSAGREEFLQLIFKPTKSAQVLVSLRVEQKEQSLSLAMAGGPIKTVTTVKKRVYRLQWQKELSSNSRLTFRMETQSTSYLMGKNFRGALTFFDWQFKWGRTAFSSHLRCQLFDTDGYESTLYAFTPQIGTNFQLSPFSGKGKNYVLFIENESIKGIIGRWGLLYEKKECKTPSPPAFSAQIVVKFHQLEASKNSRPF